MLKVSHRQNELHQLLGLRPRNQRPRIRGEGVSEKLDSAEKVLKWPPLPALPDKIAQGGAFSLSQRTLELQVKLDPVFLFKDMSQQMLRIQARAFDTLPGQVVGRGGEDLKDGHWLSTR